MIIADDHILCSLLKAHEVNGFMQNLEPPALVFSACQKRSKQYDYLKMNVGDVVYTVRKPEDYVRTVHDTFIIPLGEVVGVERL